MTATRGGVVYVVAKAPHAHEAKTRLCPPLNPEQAALLAEAFLLDTLNVVRHATLQARIICRDAAEQATLERIVTGLAPVCIQAGTGLGNALESAFLQGLADGFTAVAVLGADSPTLSPEVLRQAFNVLVDDADVALGPSEDGGYYLLAASALHTQLFRDMEWSTSEVTRKTLARCQAAGLRTHRLPTWYDVDDPTSLARLETELLHTPSGVAPNTRRQLAAYVGFESGPLPTHS